MAGRVVNREYEMVSVDDLKHHPRNPNRGDVSVITESIMTNGFYGALVVQAGTRYVLAGNHRLKAARKAGITEVPVTWVECDERQAIKIVLADNRTSELSERDPEVLASLLNELNHDDDLSGTGYDLQDLCSLLNELEPSAEPMDEPDDIDESLDLVGMYGVERGQVWDLGGQELHVASSLDAWLPDYDVLYFDPPWDLNIEWDHPRPRHVLSMGDGSCMAHSFRLFGEPTWLFVWDCVTSWYTPNRPLRRGKMCAWFGPVEDYNFDGAHYGEPGESKTVSNTRGSYDYTADPRGKHLSDVFQAPITQLHQGIEYKHGKPLDWVRMLIANCTGDGAVLDPFAGGGSTLVACEQLGRRCVGYEIEPEQAAIIIAKFESMGKSVSLRES